MAKPRVITHRCVADQYSGSDERIIEFSFKDGTGGLISLRQPTGEALGRVEVYRTDDKVTVVTPKRTYWAAYVGTTAGGDGITLHTTEREALLTCISVLDIDVLARAEESARDGEDEVDATIRVLEGTDDETLYEWMNDYCSTSACDWAVREVTTP